MTHQQRRSTDQGLSWTKAKDSIVVGLVSLVVGLLGMLLKGQIETNAALGEMKRDLAVVSEKSKEYRQDLKDLRARLLVLEAYPFSAAQRGGRSAAQTTPSSHR